MCRLLFAHLRQIHARHVRVDLERSVQRLVHLMVRFSWSQSRLDALTLCVSYRVFFQSSSSYSSWESVAKEDHQLSSRRLRASGVEGGQTRVCARLWAQNC